MNLYHISEESDIKIFNPRKPERADIDQSVGLVWAITEDRMVNFLTPRDCPRVTFYARPESSQEDINKYIGSSDTNAVVVVEEKWFQVMQDTTLYIYQFKPDNFYLQDDIAGYYVSEKPEVPVGVKVVYNLPGELARRGAKLKVLPSLWPLWDKIVPSTLGWSMCRMKNAQARRTKYSPLG